VSAELRTIELDPATWLRGEGSGPSYLYRGSDGKSCCLGVACIAFGRTTRSLDGHAEVGDVKPLPRPLVPLRRLVEGTELANTLYMINDRVDKTNDADRVVELNQELGRIGMSFRFALKDEACQ